jgi:hypothetical protein
MVRVFELSAVPDNVFERITHLGLKGLRDGCLKGLLGFHLLVENTESNILEIGDS